MNTHKVHFIFYIERIRIVTATMGESDKILMNFIMLQTDLNNSEALIV